MSRFTPEVSQQLTFDGDSVAVRFKRLTNAQMKDLGPTLQAGTSNAMLRTNELVVAGRGVMESNITHFSGLKDSAGNAIPLATALDEAYFLPLMDAVLGAMFKASVLGAEDAKKSDAQPPAVASGESANTTSSPGSQLDVGTTPSPVAPV